MTLRSIELSGFKSFGRKSLVSFTTPITAIVGPNGSGKSNIVEAIRFVLGEQSMKSLRGKGGVDLIFKGSKTLSSANHAKVEITFDNTKKIFSFSSADWRTNLSLSLDYDEVTIAREVFSDGANKYSINNTEVRLKDVIDLLSSVNIGSSGHHIISQGEADRVLNASNKDRRAMIEDALGLKIYQYRIREAERKLDKTNINMKEAQASRRELAPHLAFLKKQVQVLERAREMRDSLKDLYKEYLSKESTYVLSETNKLKEKRHEFEKKYKSLDGEISKIQKEKNTPDTGTAHAKEIKEHEGDLVLLRSSKDELARKLGRIEGILETLEKELSSDDAKNDEGSIPIKEWQSFVYDLKAQIDQAMKLETLPSVIDILGKIKKSLDALEGGAKNNDKKNNLESEYKEIKKTKDEIQEELDKITKEEELISLNIATLRAREKEMELGLRESERALYELMGERSEINSGIQALSFEEEKLTMITNALEAELYEANVLVGSEVVDFKNIKTEDEISRASQEELKKKIERIKIKLEDTGSGSGADLMKEYQETENRDQFLAREITDLNKGVEDCRLLIRELKETLDNEFKDGVEKINKQFQEFFALMFGGGSAFLSVVIEHKKSKSPSEDEEFEVEEESLDGEEGFERGIEINVTLPHKKVKDLHMLSGGERSLASIALLFAISQVNPPPFLVLDETDAALDEANSRKYGNMLESLSKYSELIVVTHNRETMSRAQVLYGVTMDSSGVSKLLSIHLEEANTYAK